MTCDESTCQRRYVCNQYRKARENDHPGLCYDYLQASEREPGRGAA